MTADSNITLTPTPRLARTLARQQALANHNEGLGAWLTPDIYSIGVWLNRLQQAYFLASNDARTPINTDQALLLWQQPIANDVFVGNPQIARLALDSWRLIHEHGIQAPAAWPSLMLSEDNHRFQLWAKAYQALCSQQNLIDEWAFAAELPAHIRSGAVALPSTINMVGFDLPLTPLLIAILNACADQGTTITPALPTTSDEPDLGAANSLTLTEFVEPEHELLAAAQWARGLLETNPNQSLAIVVPDLGGRIDQVDRALRRVLKPPSFALLPDARQDNGSEDPWHISLGKPLSAWPLVDGALSILELASNQLSQPQIQHLLRCPYLAGWPAEAEPRNQTLVRLGANAPYFLTGVEIQNALQAEHAEELASAISHWRNARREFQESAWPSQWVGRFQTELTSIGFGNGRSLSSREFQALQRWHDLLESFAALDLVSDGPITRTGALDRLRERANGTVFRERNAGAPIEVLGVAEALGSRFDAMWITTLDSNQWPGVAKRDPFVPGSLQADLPNATSDNALRQARLEMHGLLQAAPNVRGSYARGNEEIAVTPTGLLGQARLEIAQTPDLPMSAPIAILTNDSQAPTLAATASQGGTGLLKNQSACPFRAYAQHRLGARDTIPPRPGLSAAQRGTVVHFALEAFWQNITSSQALAALGEDALDEQILAAVNRGLEKFTSRYLITLNHMGRMLEVQRTHRVLKRWLTLEAQRDGFEVVATEQDVEIQIAGLELKGQIDRVDRLDDGRTVLIDYKTGAASVQHWLPDPRMKDPQLPVYALATDPQPSAIAFAHLQPHDLKFSGLAEADAGIKGVPAIGDAKRGFKDWSDWGELLDDWQVHLQALAEQYKTGYAPVDPRTPSECKYCHLQALCRVYERGIDADAVNDDNSDE